MVMKDQLYYTWLQREVILDYAYDKKNRTMAIANSHLEIAKLLLTEKVEEKIIPRILEERPFMWKP